MFEDCKKLKALTDQEIENMTHAKINEIRRDITNGIEEILDVLKYAKLRCDQLDLILNACPGRLYRWDGKSWKP